MLVRVRAGGIMEKILNFPVGKPLSWLEEFKEEDEDETMETDNTKKN